MPIDNLSCQEFLDSEPLNNMLDDMIANAVDNFDNPRKHVTYDDRFQSIQKWKFTNMSDLRWQNGPRGHMALIHWLGPLLFWNSWRWGVSLKSVNTPNSMNSMNRPLASKISIHIRRVWLQARAEGSWPRHKGKRKIAKPIHSERKQRKNKLPQKQNFWCPT